MLPRLNLESFISDYQKNLETLKRLQQENEMLKLYILELSYELKSYHNNMNNPLPLDSQLKESN